MIFTATKKDSTHWSLTIPSRQPKGAALMPLPMTHLSVANRLIEIGLQIKDESQFYLGANSPDAIHTRLNADRAAKNTTHLIPEDSKIHYQHEVNEEECTKTIADFLASYESSASPDFLMGYAVHILTDMYWMMLVYRRFALNYQKSAAPPQDQQKAYYTDTDIIDHIQYKTAPWRSNVWQMLQTARCPDLPNFLSATEIRGWNERNLNWHTAPENQYKFEGTPRFITQEIIVKFVVECAERINIFARQSLRQGKNPFEIVDLFYSESNQAELNRKIDEIETGTATFIVKTIEELEAMEND